MSFPHLFLVGNLLGLSFTPPHLICLNLKYLVVLVIQILDLTLLTSLNLGLGNVSLLDILPTLKAIFVLILTPNMFTPLDMLCLMSLNFLVYLLSNLFLSLLPTLPFPLGCLISFSFTLPISPLCLALVHLHLLILLYTLS